MARAGGRGRRAHGSLTRHCVHPSGTEPLSTTWTLRVTSCSAESQRLWGTRFGSSIDVKMHYDRAARIWRS